jgi:hypothetical protein
MDFSLLHPRDQIVATMERIYGRNMLTTSGGNVSIRHENNDVWITLARVDKGSLRRQDIVCIHPDGSRRTASAIVGKSISSQHLRGASRHSRDHPRASGSAGELQYLRSGAGHAALS